MNMLDLELVQHIHYHYYMFIHFTICEIYLLDLELVANQIHDFFKKIYLS